MRALRYLIHIEALLYMRDKYRSLEERDEQSAYIKVFYCQGGFNYDKMSLPSKLAMKAFASSLKKSKEEKYREMGARIDHSYDIADKKYLGPVISYLKEVDGEVSA